MRFVAGRECHRENLLAGGAMAKLLVRTAGESSWLGRPDRVATGRGAAVKSLREDAASCGAVTELLLAGTLQRRAIGKKAQWQKCLAVMLNLEKSVHLQHKIN